MPQTKFKKIIITILIFTFSCLHISTFAKPIQAAAVIQKTYNRTFEITEEFVKVTEIKKIEITANGWVVPQGSKEYFTIFNPFENDPDFDSKLKLTLDSIKISDGNGNSLKFKEQETINKNTIIEVEVQREISKNSPSTINLNYNSYGLSIKSGAVRDIYIPGFPTDYTFQSDQSEENVLTTVVIPANFPEISFISPEAKITKNENQTLVQIEKNNLLGNTTWIQLGIRQYYKFNIEQVIPKSTDFPFATNSITLPIPRDIESGPISQKVYYEEISPTPTGIELDKDQNLIASFDFPANSENVIRIKGFAILDQNKNYSFENSGTISDIPENLRSYLTPGEFWEVENTEILNAAEKIKGNSTKISEIIDKTFKFVVDKIDYSFVKKYGLNERQGALKTLNGGSAVCMEYSDLFITLLRAQGIPARASFGYGFSALEFESTSEDTINHQWAEVFIPSQNKWVSIDTTWGEFGNNLVGGDLNHFFSHVASANPETPSTTTISYIGDIQTLPELTYNVNVSEQINLADKQNLLEQNDLLNKFPYSNKKSLLQNIFEETSKFYFTLQTAISKIFGVSKTVANLILIFFGVLITVLVIWNLKRRKVIHHRRDAENAKFGSQ